ncbi:hypothetical protein F441_07525 [Phytophthora nicotianae CJ01A1]|uniref:Uncharacterized protein n=4 Tax=Phytophthora nicotianae TaxID=4792 RepID=V9FBD7_PHYNI|nr:hypothetical protein F443_07554 [Phytophthora nicotianae P1569]ETK88364.1 hypothetical protein L915_07371 [Phytophthora nicotianae]ETL41765.1 hypothetical protein L916_07315 [Phytophthora nicotianae]ETL94918.1 hypothetical protein L917_07206 [Phytophthora nicotianae]ETP18218.1 hypothetical protein F441_07525 [Phytophthora nicotianae CJ01A1]
MQEGLASTANSNTDKLDSCKANSRNGHVGHVHDELAYWRAHAGFQYEWAGRFYSRLEYGQNVRDVESEV